jgi:hypothetical protein
MYHDMRTPTQLHLLTCPCEVASSLWYPEAEGCGAAWGLRQFGGRNKHYVAAALLLLLLLGLLLWLLVLLGSCHTAGRAAAVLMVWQGLKAGDHLPGINAGVQANMSKNCMRRTQQCAGMLPPTHHMRITSCKQGQRLQP